MGKKGDTRKAEAQAAADATVASLAPLGAVTSRGMFGGFGIFHEGIMFGLVDSAGVVHLRVSDDTRGRFEEEGGEAHGRMPYFSVPDTVHADPEKFSSWAAEALAVAQAAKRK